MSVEAETPLLYMSVVPYLFHCSKRVVFTGHYGWSGARPSPRHGAICRRQLDERLSVAASVAAGETGGIVQPASSFIARYGIVMSNRWARRG